MAGVVLALDLATVTGWCVGAPGARPAYGSIRLEGRERAARYGALLDWLDDAQKIHRFERVLFEAPMVTGDFRGRDAALLALGLAAHLEFWCWDEGVRCADVHSGTARKAVLGKGGGWGPGGAKPVVIGWCRGQGFNPQDDNAADAILLWHHATGYRPQGSIAA